MKNKLMLQWRRAAHGGLPLLFWLACQLSSEANPTGGTVVQGSASISTVGSQVTINQTSANAFINWQSFNLVPGETTTFNQPSASSVAWNYISDSSASSINGSINANGYVVLQNPNGFTIGGQAAITAHGLVMTTASTPGLDLSGGGAWSFNAPPPTAQIVNYGHITMTDGGSAYLIASDIINNGTISAPGGKIGLYAGEKVLVSMAPDGRGLSAEVTLPKGSVDNKGSLIADKGIIAAKAQFVNQEGLVQANTVQNVNGVIELVASDQLSLGASSQISASGETAASGASPGGFVVLNAGTSTFSDLIGSTISVAGVNTGQAGILEIMGNGVTAANIHSSYGSPYAFLVNPNNVTISDSATSVSANPNLNTTALSKYSQIDLHALNDITLSGSATLQTGAGDINLFAGGSVTVGSGAIRTIAGGNITVTAASGNVNTGTSTSGFNYVKNAPYFSPFQAIKFTGTFSSSTSLGGISTAAGGNVTITAGGDVTSYLPSGTEDSATGDAGTGAFGSQPGNVTITAGGNVYGHYVVVNGTGSVNADKNIGSSSMNVALSLVKGTWNLNTPGDIYLQEVRNPNGVFNTEGTLSTSQHYFNYDPLAAVNLVAGDGIYLTGLNLPRTPDAFINGINYLPILLPPTLNITAGAGGLTLEDNFTLFPSSSGNFNITTTDGGNFSSGGSLGLTYSLMMSDSSQTHWFYASNNGPFDSTDHNGAPSQLNNYDPVVVNIDGNMNNVVLTTTKETHISVRGDMTDCSFYGQNLHAGDNTSIDVGGKISSRPSFTYVTLNQDIQTVPLTDLPPNTINNWQTLLTLAVDPVRAASLKIPASIDPSQYQTFVNGLLLFGNSLQSSIFYDSATKRLIYLGQMTQETKNILSQPLTVVRYGPDGNPLVDASGHLVTDTINWVSGSSIQQLYADSQNAVPKGSLSGYMVGGTGNFSINADSISLGGAYGILSIENGNLLGRDYSYLTPYLKDVSGASIDVTVYNNLEMPSSTIAALGSGNVTVNSLAGSMDLGSQFLVAVEAEIMKNNLGLGIYTSGGGNVQVTALGTINIDSSRIASFNGGDIFIESYTGDVNAGTGGSVSIPVNVFSPKAGKLTEPFEYVYANGIVAQTLVNASLVPDSAEVPGDITVLTPQGSIYASKGGILQEALNGNISAGPSITLTAGSEGYIGNIDLGDSGVIGGTVNLTANGNITGLVISRQNSNVNAAQSFSGTVLSGGSASLSAGGSVSGTIIGVGGVNASGAGGVSATLLGQNVSVNGGASQSTLGTSATATSASQSAAGTSSDLAKQQVASDSNDDDDLKKKKKPQIRKVSRVTVILSSAVPAQ